MAVAGAQPTISAPISAPISAKVSVDIPSAGDPADNADQANEPGWSALLRLGFRPLPGRAEDGAKSPAKTVLASRERFGPLAVQRPFYPEGGVCHVYLLHPPGGVVGGDLLQIETTLEPGSHALVTTPGATKFYRSAAEADEPVPGQLARQLQRLTIADKASLEWLPQENIYFPGARAAMQTRIDLHGAAQLAWWEINCLGLPVNDAAFDAGSLSASLEVHRDGQPLLVERLRVDPQSRLRSALLAGQPVNGTAIFSQADQSHLDMAREQISADAAEAGSKAVTIAATLIEDLLILRYLGTSTEQARKAFGRVWQRLRQPLFECPASTPRIWNT